MAKNRIFFPQEALDGWLTTGVVELNERDLLLKEERQRYRLTEGVRILSEVSGEPDKFDIVGRCKTIGFLQELGADILERSMIIDNNAYDIAPGFLGTPVEELVEMEVSPLSSDVELLAQFLAKNM